MEFPKALRDPGLVSLVAATVVSGGALFLSTRPTSPLVPATATAPASPTVDAPLDGDAIQEIVRQAQAGTLTPAQVQARITGLVEGLAWPARPVGQPGVTCRGNPLRVFVQSP